MKNHQVKSKGKFGKRALVTVALAVLAHPAGSLAAEQPATGAAGAGDVPGSVDDNGPQKSKQTDKFQQKAWDGSRPEFEYLDTNSNHALEWREIAPVYTEELEQLQWDKRQAIGRFDQNGDDKLSELEYGAFLNALIRETGLEVNFSEPEELSGQGASEAAGARGGMLLAQVEDQPVIIEESESAPGQISEDTVSEDPTVEVDGAAVTVTPQNLHGMRVVNLHAEEIGEVSEVVVTEQGQLSGLVVTIGDLASVDDKAVFVSAAEIEPTGEVVIWRTNMNEQDMDGLPDYNSETLSQSAY